MIRREIDGDLWIVTLDRPEKANALTREMLQDLCDIVEDAETAKALILTGAGKVFSAGADLGQAKAGLATDPVWELLSGAIAALPCLTIAAINGTLAGGAFGMALACDLRVAAPSASFFYPVARLGFLPQPSDPVRLAALIGSARAKMILLAGERVSADEALAWGLVDRVCEDVLAQARRLAAQALVSEKEHLAAIKGMI